MSGDCNASKSKIKPAGSLRVVQRHESDTANYHLSGSPRWSTGRQANSCRQSGPPRMPDLRPSHADPGRAGQSRPECRHGNPAISTALTSSRTGGLTHAHRKLTFFERCLGRTLGTCTVLLVGFLNAQTGWIV